MNKKQKLVIIEAASHLEAEDYNYMHSKIREAFPEVFELRKEGWFKHNAGGVVYRCSETKGYGFSTSGAWICLRDWDFNRNPDNWNEIKPEDTHSFFKKESLCRGFIEGAAIDNTNIGHYNKGDNIISKEYEFNNKSTLFCIGGLTVFKDGEWAKLYKELTLSEIEKELGYSIKVVL